MYIYIYITGWWGGGGLSKIINDCISIRLRCVSCPRVICYRTSFYPDVICVKADSIQFYVGCLLPTFQLTKVTCCTHDIAQSMIAHDYEARVRENDGGVAFQIRSMNVRVAWRRLSYGPRATESLIIPPTDCP